VAEASRNTGRPVAALQWLSEDQIKDVREITPQPVTKEITTLKP